MVGCELTGSHRVRLTMPARAVPAVDRDVRLHGLTGATHVMTALRYSGGIVLAGVLFGIAFMGLGVALVRHRPTDQVSDAVPIAES
jgi:hypothetical protein